ncbi:MAG: SH3 domain-containing protein [Candidatus Aminicenantes bacterium]
MREINTTKNIIKSLMIFFIIISFLSFSYGDSEAVKLRVSVNTANIRLKPSDESLIVATVHLGTILEYQAKQDHWIRVNLPPDEKGYVISGYIHENQVEKTEKKKEPIEELGSTTAEIKEKSTPEEKIDELKKPDKADHSMFSVGLGYGLPYGILGMNCEFNTIFPAEERVFDYIALTGGFGYFTGGVKYVFGLRIYPLGRKPEWQPRLSAYYGTTGFYKTYGGNAKNYSGPAFGAGILWLSKSKISIDLELQYRIINAPIGYVKEKDADFTLSAGVQYHF